MSFLPSAEDRLKRWKERWEVHDPDVLCRHCGGRQAIHVSHRTFNDHHIAGCPRSSDLPQFPWKDLTLILKDWKKEIGRAPRDS
jgi:hypothetical protein